MNKIEKIKIYEQAIAEQTEYGHFKLVEKLQDELNALKEKGLEEYEKEVSRD